MINIKVDQSLITNLHGYSVISQLSYLNAGGVGFDIANNLDFTILSDFTKPTEDFEALWIEVQNIGHPNLLYDFLNILGSSFFLPQILQPTRITYHSATLIDNISFSSLEHLTISGNIVYGLTDHLANIPIFNRSDSLPCGV